MFVVHNERQMKHIIIIISLFACVLSAGLSCKGGGTAAGTTESKPKYKVSVEKDVMYGKEKGFWTGYPRVPGLSFTQIYMDHLGKVIDGREECLLTMDIYKPQDTGKKARPLFVFIHGGAFYYQDKADPECEAWCRHFAELGYVAASINYRMGYGPSKFDATRAGYRAAQDANAAVRHLVGDRNLNIDPDRVFLAGCSAGAITALNLAFMGDADRPSATRGGRVGDVFDNLFGTSLGDMGSIDAVNGSDSTRFTIRAICNMWGAVPDLEMIGNNKVAIISFHSENDPTVPFGYDYPFKDYFQKDLFEAISSTTFLKQALDRLSLREKINSVIFEKMYGSQYIDQKARELGYRSKLYRYEEPRHNLFMDDGQAIEQQRLDEMMQLTEDFFAQEPKNKRN